jgi:hypothetical protein
VVNSFSLCALMGLSSGRLAMRMLARDWRAGELTVLGIA